MIITIQLTEIPANETVTNRVFTLPETGGNFGSAFDCFMPLPDRSGQVNTVHGQFVPNQHGMCIEALNSSKISLNGATLAPGRLAVIEDGTIIEVADYTLLISQIGEEVLLDITDESDNVVNSSHEQAQTHFSLTGLTMDTNDDVVMHTHQSDHNNLTETKQNQANTHFSASGVFADDPFGEDPFSEEDIIWQNDKSNESSGQNEQQIDTQTDVTISAFEDNLSSEHLTDNINNNHHDNLATRAEVLPLNDYQQDAKVAQLVQLVDRQLTSANEQQNKLFQALDKTLATFLDEFSPEHLEENYNDYGRPLFVGKEQQYWRLYRKSFNRRLSKGEYQRLFKALLLENMQAGQD